MQTELLDIKDKYSSLKKRVKQVEKDNDELFAENSRIEKQLSVCQSQLKSYEEASKETVMP
jgi:FtsZ-binding cell division protein ZapB